MLEDAARTVRTVRHLKVSQVWHRLYRWPKREALRRWGPDYLRWIRRKKAVPRGSPFPRFRGRSAVASGAGDGGELDVAILRARRILEGRFSFLNREASWQHPIDWNREDQNLDLLDSEPGREICSPNQQHFSYHFYK